MRECIAPILTATVMDAPVRPVERVGQMGVPPLDCQSGIWGSDRL